MPVISIIIAAYNVEPYVGKTLASIFDTTAPTEAFEVIVVDDGSEDGTLDVVRRFADRPNLRILEQENKGVSAARNQGLEKATGAYVWFMDSDDWLVDDGLRIVLDALEAHPEADMLMYPLKWVYVQENHEYLDYRRDRDETVPGKAVIRDLRLPLWSNMRFVFKRSLTENKWVTYPEGLIHEDEYYGLVLAYLAGTVRVMKDHVYNYRIRSGSLITSRSIRSAYDVVSIHKLMIRFLEEAVDPADRNWFRAFCFFRLDSKFKTFFRELDPAGFSRFARKNGYYIWRQWLTVHPGEPLKHTVGRLFYYTFPAFRKQLLEH